MGYWNQGADGSSLHTEETGLIWGDSPADVFDAAIADAVRIFTEDVGREPTEEELTAGFQFSLGGWFYGRGETLSVASKAGET